MERQCWYNDYIKQQKTVVKNQEWKWTKYRLESNWKNYKKERNIYNRMIKYSKHQMICEKINESSNDAKKLYALVNHLSGCTQENPLPINKSDEILAEEFADFFINKIRTIREKFKGIDCYHHQPVDAPIFRKFRPMTESEICKIIMSMKSKSCELDPIPTTLMKRLLPKCICIITNIVNISLETGQFYSGWKVAVVQPLLKKPGLDLVHKNYRPVSNLSFLSKVIE